MITKKLSSQQTNWAESLSRFHFTIQWRPGKLNMLADTLTRQTDVVAAQNKVREQYRIQILLLRD